MTSPAMLEAYYYFLQYRIDFVLLALLVAAGCFCINRQIRRRGPQYYIPWKSFIAAAFLVVAGGLLAEWIAQDRINRLEKLFAGIGPTYALELSDGGHAKITLDTAPDDPVYLKLIEAEKRWLTVNPVISDIYTYRADQNGKIRLIVDSETDYDHNGRYEGEREQRTKIGELDEDVTPEFFRALKGETAFDSSFTPDRWGISVSSFTPIYGPDGKVEAGLGIDYPAESWLLEIGTVRTVSLGVALILIIILLTSSTLVSFLSAEIEERKETQRRLEQASESAFSASAAKSEFLALMSHEVRNPLTAILGFANILGDTPLDSKQRRYVDTINRAGSSLLDLLNGILDYTRVESGKLALEHIAWSPAMLVHEIMELMTDRAAAKGLQLNFNNRLPDDLTLFGDPTRMRQILLNLVNNAIKFTAQGSVSVSACWQAEANRSDFGRLVLEVIDTGEGIPADKVTKLFEAFTQADSSTTRRHGGTGLGLAICKRLTEMMGGTIRLESVLGQGTKFTVTIDSDATAACFLGRFASEATARTAPVRNKALVIDDARLNRELLKVMLRRLGFDADLAASGPEAVKLAAQSRYTIIFTDLEMPDMDGFATAREIRAQEPAGRRTPMVAVSALTAAGTREKCVAAGMDEYLTKPVYLPALKSEIEALLPQHRFDPAPSAARSQPPVQTPAAAA